MRLGIHLWRHLVDVVSPSANTEAFNEGGGSPTTVIDRSACYPIFFMWRRLNLNLLAERPLVYVLHLLASGYRHDRESEVGGLTPLSDCVTTSDPRHLPAVKKHLRGWYVRRYIVFAGANICVCGSSSPWKYINFQLKMTYNPPSMWIHSKVAFGESPGRLGS